jgi:adenylate cyclase
MIALAPGRLRNAANLGAVVLICALAAMLVTRNFSPLTRVDNFVQEWEAASVFAPQEAQDSDILIVAIDEPTLRQFAYRSPVDRHFVSELLRTIAAHGPAAIGLDLLLDQPTEDAKDTALRRTISDIKIPLFVSYVASPEIVSPEQKSFEDAIVPSSKRGMADLPTDQFDTVREVFAGAFYDGRFVPSFARALAASVGVQTPTQQVPIVWHGRPPASATDADPKPFRQISAQLAGLMPDSWFRGKIVLVGSDVTLVDRHRTPFSTILAGDAGQLPGVVIQAHSLSQLLRHKASPLVSWWADFAVNLLVALLGVGLGVVDLAVILRFGMGLLLIGLLWVGGIAVYHFANLMFGLIAPVLSLVGAFGMVDALAGRDARRQRAFIQGAFGRYVSPEVVSQMVQDPSRMSLEGERRLMTYLFSDIENFTTMSEKLESKELAHLVNTYLDGMTEIIMRHGGMVDKFIGDAVFAIFNAPIDLPDHAQQAVRCMLAMDHFTERFRCEQQSLGIPLGVTRIGVHTGIAVIGNFGSQARFTYTAQGDAVNTAARLEGINKFFGTRLCVSDATRRLCRDIAFRPVASVKLKGKTQALELWEPLHEGAVTPEFLDAYLKTYDDLKHGRADMNQQLGALLKVRPDDPCVRLHLERQRQGKVGIEMEMTEK